MSIGDDQRNGKASSKEYRDHEVGREGKEKVAKDGKAEEKLNPNDEPCGVGVVEPVIEKREYRILAVTQAHEGNEPTANHQKSTEPKHGESTLLHAIQLGQLQHLDNE